jgi:hypothetical protein
VKIRFQQRAIALLVGAISLCGCGYHFEAAGSALPASASTIHVESFQNLSRYTGIQDELGRAIKDEIAKHKRLELVDDAGAADLRLSGSIRSVDEFPAANNSVDEPLVYNYQIIIDANLLDTKTQKNIWSVHGLNSQQQFAVVAQAVVLPSQLFLRQNFRANDIARLPDLQLAATQRGATREGLLGQIAHDLYAQMSEGF